MLKCVQLPSSQHTCLMATCKKREVFSAFLEDCEWSNSVNIQKTEQSPQICSRFKGLVLLGLCKRCHGLVPWSFTLAATEKLNKRS